MRAIGWDHPRCMQPMLAASDAWQRLTGVTVAWDFRPLADFNDQPLHELAPWYDLLVIDHPAIPEAVAHDALHSLESLLPDERVRRLEREAVGPSGRSYRWERAVWALPVDAACQVSARRPAMLQALDEPEPMTWSDVLALARRRPGSVALPLLPADALCSLLSIAATHRRALTLEGAAHAHADAGAAPEGAPLAHADAGAAPEGAPLARADAGAAPEGAPLVLDADAAPLALNGVVDASAVALLAELAPLLHPASWTSAPPQLLARMAAGEPIAYVPLTFGYNGLAGEELRFGDAPAGPDGRRAPILGGAGLAVSAASRDPELAAGFAAWLCEEDAQREVVLRHGGQPAHAAVWSRPRNAVGPAAAGFFQDTRASIDAAWVRPAHPAWPAFHREAGAELARALGAGDPAETIARRLQDRLDAMRAAA